MADKIDNNSPSEFLDNSKDQSQLPVADNGAGNNYIEASNIDLNYLKGQNQANVPNINLYSLILTDDEFPIDLDVVSEFQNILAAGILKNTEYSTYYNKMSKILLEKRTIKLCTLLFWITYIIKFQPKHVILLEKLRNKIGKTYSKFFAQLAQPKETLINLTLFLCGYAIHVMFYNIFVAQRDLFNMRFILDCYHIVIFEINGIYVSDYYIQNFIEKIFSSKFFQYEKEKILQKKRAQKKDLSNELLLRNLNVDVASLVSIPGTIELANELANKLHKNSKKAKLLASIGGPESPNITKTQASNKYSKERSRNNSRDGNNMLASSNNNNVNNDSEGAEIQEASKYLPKMKFNCLQISPTVSRFLNNQHMTLPFRAKKVIQYSNNKHLADIKKIKLKSSNIDTLLNKKQEKKELKRSQTTNLLLEYDLKNRNEDYDIDHVPPDMKNRFRQELDVKYMLDNLPMKIEPFSPLKQVAELLNKKHGSSTSTTSLPPIKRSQFVANSANTLPQIKIIQNNIPIRPGSDDIMSMSDNTRKLETIIQNRQDDMLNSSNYGEDEHGLHESLHVGMITGGVGGVGTGAGSINSKNILNVFAQSKAITHLLSGKKTQSIKNKYEEKIEKSDSSVKDSRIQLESRMGEIRDSELKVKVHENTKNARLNSLLPPEDEKIKSKVFVYQDRRKEYLGRHQDLVYANVDSNIDNLVHKIIHKKAKK